MNIDDKRFPRSIELIQALDLIRKTFKCSGVKIGVSGNMHSLSQIKENLLQLSAQKELGIKEISAMENKSAEILSRLRTPYGVLHITPW